MSYMCPLFFFLEPGSNQISWIALHCQFLFRVLKFELFFFHGMSLWQCPGSLFCWVSCTAWIHPSWCRLTMHLFPELPRVEFWSLVKTTDDIKFPNIFSYFSVLSSIMQSVFCSWASRVCEGRPAPFPPRAPAPSSSALGYCSHSWASAAPPHHLFSLLHKFRPSPGYTEARAKELPPC